MPKRHKYRIKCPICSAGYLVRYIGDYRSIFKASDGEIYQYEVKNFIRERCEQCREDFLDAKALDILEQQKGIEEELLERFDKDNKIKKRNL